MVSRPVPPGRAGRLWLRRMLGTVERGREQLDRRLRVLLPELQWRRIDAERREQEWATAWQEAQTWLVRSELLSGRAALQQSAPASDLEVSVRWASAMGCTYPAEITVTAWPSPSVLPAQDAAVPEARRAFDRALEAALRAAAAREAVRRMEEDIALTRRRLHGLEKRWIPWLLDSLHRVDQDLEQIELEDAIRLRRAVAALGRSTGPGAAAPRAARTEAPTRREAR